MSDQRPAQRLAVDIGQGPCADNNAALMLWLFSFVLCIPKGLIPRGGCRQQNPNN